MTQLGRELAGAAAKVPAAATAPAPVLSALGLALAGTGAVVYRDVVVRVGAGIPARMRLLGHDEEVAATVAFGGELLERQLGGDGSPFVVDVIEQARARQYLARSVFAAGEPGSPEVPLGTAEDWRNVAITSAVLEPLWVEYADMRRALDGLADPLPPAEASAIADAVEKKNGQYLVACGTNMLVRWLLSTDGQPAGSPTLRSAPSFSEPPDTASTTPAET